MTLPFRLLFCVLVAVASLAGPVAANDALRQEGLDLFGILPLPPPRPSSDPVVALGRGLYWDPAISVNGKTSCASCHPASAWGADPVEYSAEASGNTDVRNAPTVFNASLATTLRWLGDRPNSAQQAEGSLTGAMGFPSREAALTRLRERGYEPAFRAAFSGEPDAFSTAKYGLAIAAYEETLKTPSPFDRFLEGDNAALSVEQQAGMRAFIDTGCAKCHSGALFGGTTFKKFGIVRDYWELTGSTTRDPGRFSITKQEADRFVFRVPMLRNVARTAPYFHDGSVRTLGRAVRIMAEVQIGTTLDDRTARQIVAFLNALTGPVPRNYAPPRVRAAAP